MKIQVTPSACWLQIQSAEGALAHLLSSDTPVVVMEPPEDRDCVDAAVRLESTWNRLLVPKSLVRTRFVVVADVLGDDAPEVILTEDEDVVEDLSPECADKPPSKGIHVRRAYRRDHRDIQNSIWFDCKALGRVLRHIARADA